MNPFYVYRGKKIKRTKMSVLLWEGFFIKKKQKDIKNEIYIVLRPDKDKIANKLFPGKKVIILRYDKPDDKKMIEKYKNSL